MLRAAKEMVVDAMMKTVKQKAASALMTMLKKIKMQKTVMTMIMNEKRSAAEKLLLTLTNR
jgi:hypothetical protein